MKKALEWLKAVWNFLRDKELREAVSSALLTAAAWFTGLSYEWKMFFAGFTFGILVFWVANRVRASKEHVKTLESVALGKEMTKLCACISTLVECNQSLPQWDCACKWWVYLRGKLDTFCTEPTHEKIRDALSEVNMLCLWIDANLKIQDQRRSFTAALNDLCAAAKPFLKQSIRWNFSIRQD